jgi:hypothetical protein
VSIFPDLMSASNWETFKGASADCLIEPLIPGASLSRAFSSQEITPFIEHLEVDGRMRSLPNGNSLRQTS